MSMVSVDTFATTNPALCSLIVRAFVEGYVVGDAAGAPLPLILLPIPFVLTEDTSATFARTNANTGFLPWLGRFPEVTINLGDRIRRTAEFSRQGLLFGIRKRVLSVASSGSVILDGDGLRRKPNFPASTEVGCATSYARRLGVWCGQVRSAETIFLSLGVQR